MWARVKCALLASRIAGPAKVTPLPRALPQMGRWACQQGALVAARAVRLPRAHIQACLGVLRWARVSRSALLDLRMTGPAESFLRPEGSLSDGQGASRVP